jgi:hypothetical protein
MMIFYVFYLESCIWPDAILWWIRLWICTIFSIYLRKREMGILAMIRQVFGKECMSHTGVWMERSKLTKNEKGETSGEQSQEHAYHFLWHEADWLFTKSLPNSQILRTTVTFMAIAWKHAKTLIHTLLTEELPVLSLQYTIFFTRQFSAKINMTVVPHLPYSPDLAPCNFSDP